MKTRYKLTSGSWRELVRLVLIYHCRNKERKFEMCKRIFPQITMRPVYCLFTLITMTITCSDNNRHNIKVSAMSYRTKFKYSLKFPFQFKQYYNAFFISNHLVGPFDLKPHKLLCPFYRSQAVNIEDSDSTTSGRAK